MREGVKLLLNSNDISKKKIKKSMRCLFPKEGTDAKNTEPQNNIRPLHINTHREFLLRIRKDRMCMQCKVKAAGAQRHASLLLVSGRGWPGQVNFCCSLSQKAEEQCL